MNLAHIHNKACNFNSVSNSLDYKKARASAMYVSMLLCVGFSLSGCVAESDTEKAKTQTFEAARSLAQDVAQDLALVEVDANSNQTTNDQNVKSGAQIALETAKDLTTGDGGLFENPPSKLNIRVVDATQVGSYVDNRAPLDVRPFSMGNDDLSYNVPKKLTLASKALSTPQNMTAEVNQIQIGSFRSQQRAKEAWSALVAKHPDLTRFTPQLQSVETKSGVLVRLRMGPVTPQNAREICSQLSIKDTWCVRAARS